VEVQHLTGCHPAPQVDAANHAAKSSGGLVALWPAV
jgi:hypothetical protein